MPKITKKGQITIPQEIRDKFAMLPGTEVKIIARNNQVFIVKSRRENKFLKWLGRGKGQNRSSIDLLVDNIRGRINE